MFSLTFLWFIFSRFVKLIYDLGKGIGEATSNLRVNLNTWYTVGLSRLDRNATLTVTGDTPVNVLSPKSAVALDVHSNFYLGGVRKLSVFHSRKGVDSSVQDFSGCIDHFEVCSLIHLQLTYLK